MDNNINLAVLQELPKNDKEILLEELNQLAEVIVNEYLKSKQDSTGDQNAKR